MSKVTIFTTTTCKYCGPVKDYLKAHGVPYEEVLLDHHPERIQESVEISGTRAVPVTKIVKDDGSVAAVLGWDEGGLSDRERRLILWNMGFFSTAESLTANNIVLSVYRHLTNPECRQYLLRQAYEEAIHTDTFIYCCDSLGLNPEEVYTMYLTIPNIAAKDDFVVDMTKSLLDADFVPNTPENIQRYVHDLIGYYVIMEGIFFYAGFVMMLSFKRQNRMIGVAEQFQYILRDESIHLAFGSDLVNTIVDENPSIWTPEFQKSITDNIVKAVELEHTYAKDCLPEPLLGLNQESIRQYLEYIADRRLERIRLPKIYGAATPFPWMSDRRTGLCYWPSNFRPLRKSPCSRE